MNYVLLYSTTLLINVAVHTAILTVLGSAAAAIAYLAATGLTITSPAGDVTLRSPPTVLASELRAPFDAVILSCKAYDLDGAIASFAPAVGPDTAVVPLLNGMRHLDALDARFGQGRVLGGSCFISAKVDDAGRIAHVSDPHRLVFGEGAGGRPDGPPEGGRPTLQSKDGVLDGSHALGRVIAIAVSADSPANFPESPPVRPRG